MFDDAGYFHYPRPKDSRLGRATASMMRARPASPESTEARHYRKYVPRRSGADAARDELPPPTLPAFLTSLHERFAGKPWQYPPGKSAAEETIHASAAREGSASGHPVLQECRALIKSLRRRTEASPFKDEGLTVDTIRGHKSEDPLFTLSFEAPLSLNLLKRGAREAPASNGRDISPYCEPKHAADLAADLAAGDECSPLQGLLLQTVKGEPVACRTCAEEDGIFLASVAGSLELLQIQLLFHPSFGQQVKVTVDGVLVPAEGQSVLELGGEGRESEFCLEIEYPEDNNTLVSDQYLLRVQRGGGRGEALVPESPALAAPRASRPRGEGETEIEHEIEHFMRLEKQLETLERHFAENGNDVPTSGRGRQVKRHFTPNSPLATEDLFQDDSVSLASSQGSAYNSTSPLRLSSDALESPLGVAGHRQRKTISSSTKAHLQATKVKSRKAAANADTERLAVASERIQRLEAQLSQHREVVQNHMSEFHSDYKLHAESTREELVGRQRGFEQSASQRLDEMQQSIRDFSDSLLGRIEDEKSLIQEKSKRIEERLNEKVGSLVEMLQVVQETTVSSSKRVDERLGTLDKSQGLLHDRLLKTESQCSSLGDDVAALDRSVRGMESRNTGFKEAVLADISALEELMHSEKKERQTEDESIIAALNMYTETISESLKQEKVC